MKLQVNLLQELLASCFLRDLQGEGDRAIDDELSWSHKHTLQLGVLFNPQ
jgi:hypothetical protein